VRKIAGPTAHSPPLAESTQPEQIDLEDAVAEAAPDPVAAYEEERRREAAQRELWGDVLQALQGFAAAELERMTAVLLLLEDLRGGAEREPKLHLSMAQRKR
jgi:hypothetical protein